MGDGIKLVKNTVVVMSGKGGVGKSTVAVNLAFGLLKAGKKVGLLDVDIHGPSVPKMLKLEHATVLTVDGMVQPVDKDGLKVMSIGFMLEDRDSAVIWRGPMKYNVIKQFLEDVAWGDLDYLVIDSPPGTGDEPLTVVQMIKNALGAIIVTTPQDVALSDVRKSVTFCRQLSFPVIGVVENMSGFICPKCGERTDIFKSGGGEAMALDMGIRFLGKIPIDSRVVEAGDDGVSFMDDFVASQVAQAFQPVINAVIE